MINEDSMCLGRRRLRRLRTPIIGDPLVFANFAHRSIDYYFISWWDTLECFDSISIYALIRNIAATEAKINKTCNRLAVCLHYTSTALSCLFEHRMCIECRELMNSCRHSITLDDFNIHLYVDVCSTHGPHTHTDKRALTRSQKSEKRDCCVTRDGVTVSTPPHIWHLSEIKWGGATEIEIWRATMSTEIFEWNSSLSCCGEIFFSFIHTIVLLAAVMMVCCVSALLCHRREIEKIKSKL